MRYEEHLLEKNSVSEMKHVKLFETYHAEAQKYRKKLDQHIGEYVYHKSLADSHKTCMQLAQIGLQIKNGDLLPFPSSMDAETSAKNWKRSMDMEMGQTEGRKNKVLKFMNNPRDFEKEVEIYIKKKGIGIALKSDHVAIELRKKIEAALHQGRGKLKGATFNF